MSRPRDTVYDLNRYGFSGGRWGTDHRPRWAVLDELKQYTVAKCDSRSDARRVAEALNKVAAA
jgi:hypothetical protein